MKKINQIKWHTRVTERLMQGVGLYTCAALFVTLFTAAIPSRAASIAPSVPPVVYAEITPDLEVKVLGGKIVIQRTFAEGKWHPNYNWANLHFTFDSFDGSVKTITRGKVEYTRTASGVFSYRKRDTIRQTSGGFRWQDRSGNWIDFDAQGQIAAYGDRNDVRVSFTYETVGSGKRISGIKDHLDNQVLWYEYTGDLLTAIRDYTNRRVEYRYTNNQLTSVVDANGNTWTYGYTGSLPTTFTDPENRTITRTWVGNGELASLRYADGIGADYKYEYDSSKTLFYKQERTTSGRVTEFWINSDGEVVRQDINGKNVKTFVTDTYARTRTESDIRGLTTTREYDQWDNLTKVTYPDGATITTSYDPVFSQPTQKTDERGVISKYEYDGKGNLTRFTEAFGRPEQRITEYTYDQYGQRVEMRRLADANTQTAVIRYEYGDSYGNLTANIDAENYRTEFSNHDVMGNFRMMRDAKQKIWTRTYDNLGKPASQTTPLNLTKLTEYDKSGRRIKRTDQVGNIIVFGYDDRGNLITVTDPYGNISRFEHDANNNRTKESDQEGRSQAIEYDLDGRVVKQTDGNGNITQYIYGDAGSAYDGLLVKTIHPTFTQELQYDARGRITEMSDVLDANGRFSTRVVYDASGALTRVTDSENNTKTYEYDALGRLVKVTDPAQNVTTYSYDNRDNLIEIQDPRGKFRRFAYDRRNLMTQEIRPLGQTITFTFGATGNLERITDAKGQSKSYTYDDAGRRTGESHYDSINTTSPIKTITYQHNELDAITAWNTGAESGTINYDSRRIRRLGETLNYGSFELTYRYDYYSNGLKRSFTGPDNVTVNYTYDNNNQLSNLTLPIGVLTVNQYRWTAPERITLPGGTTRTNSYDSLMRLTGINVKDPAQNELMNYQYSHDSINNVLEKTTEHGEYGYSYDNLYRLTNVTNPSPLTSETYTYDSLGNRLTDNSVQGSFTYNDNNQLTNYGSTAIAYDENGNAITKTDADTTTNFVYDADDRLTDVKVTNTTNNTTEPVASYGYDPFGRRLWKQVQNFRTYFLYSQEGLIAETDSTGSLNVLYGYKPHALWGTDPVYMKRGNNYYFYQNDFLGTPQQLVATDGTVVWRGKARSFGDLLVDTSSTIENNLRFPGQYFDRETGMHYNWERYYDPGLGRYTTSDPVGLAGGLNEFLYVDARPTVGFDPHGLTAFGSDGLAVVCHYTGRSRDAGSSEKKENDNSWESDWTCCILVYGGISGQGICNALRIRLELREVQFFHDVYDLYLVTKTEDELECTRHKNYQCSIYDIPYNIWIPGQDRKEFIKHHDQKWYHTRLYKWAEYDPCPIGPPGPPRRRR